MSDPIQFPEPDNTYLFCCSCSSSLFHIENMSLRCAHCLRFAKDARVVLGKPVETRDDTGHKPDIS